MNKAYQFAWALGVWGVMVTAGWGQDQGSAGGDPSSQSESAARKAVEQANAEQAKAAEAYDAAKYQYYRSLKQQLYNHLTPEAAELEAAMEVLKEQIQKTDNADERLTLEKQLVDLTRRVENRGIELRQHHQALAWRERFVAIKQEIQRLKQGLEQVGNCLDHLEKLENQISSEPIETRKLFFDSMTESARLGDDYVARLEKLLVAKLYTGNKTTDQSPQDSKLLNIVNRGALPNPELLNPDRQASALLEEIEKSHRLQSEIAEARLKDLAKLKVKEDLEKANHNLDSARKLEDLESRLGRIEALLEKLTTKEDKQVP